MSKQCKPPNGESIWNLNGIRWKDLECGSPDYSSNPWVKWQDRIWLFKRKELSLCEVTGYQISEALQLPVQPWIAFFQTAPEERFGRKNRIGILVERWESSSMHVPLWEPAKTHPDLIGRALALGVLDRQEWPRWLVAGPEVRLFDLEFTGPFVFWPPQRTPLENYRAYTKHALEYSSEKAREAEVVPEFVAGLKHLLQLNFDSVLDFSGHPHGASIKRTLVRGLEARRNELEKLATRWGV